MIVAYIILFMTLVVVFSSMFANLAQLGDRGTFYLGGFVFGLFLLVMYQQVRIIMA